MSCSCRWSKPIFKRWQEQGTPPRIGLSRSVYPAADKQTALASIRTEVMRSVEGLIAQGQLPAGLSLEQYCSHLNIAYGHPDEVAATLRADRILPFATDLIVQFSPAMPPFDEAMRMLEADRHGGCAAVGVEVGSQGDQV